jgi:hypothetical protein
MKVLYMSRRAAAAAENVHLVAGGGKPLYVVT